MKDIIWDGITKSEILYPEAAAERKRLFNLAKLAQWDEVIGILVEIKDFLIGNQIHSVEPDDDSFNNLIHYAALTGADVEIVEKLLTFGASRYQRNAKNQTALDIAKEQRYDHLYAALEPEPKIDVADGVMAELEKNFHSLIMSRADFLVQKHSLRLPQLDMILECEKLTGYFPVVGMYGGFRVFLKQEDSNLKLTSRSECRVVGGSGQTHEVTVAGVSLIEDGW